jgi:hypothetical protein
MPTKTQQSERKASALATIQNHAAAVAAVSGATPVALHALGSADDLESVELLDLVAQLAAAVAELAGP